MSDYTPTTEEVIYAATRPHVDAYLSLPEFKRWLAAHDREVREQATAEVRAAIGNLNRLDEYGAVPLRHRLRHVNRIARGEGQA